MENAVPYMEYKLSAAQRGLDMLTDEGKIDYLKRVSAILSDLSPVEADIYIKKISKETDISEGAIRMEISGNTNREKSDQRPLRRTGAVSYTHLAERSASETVTVMIMTTEAILYG